MVTIDDGNAEKLVVRTESDVKALPGRGKRYDARDLKTPGLFIRVSADGVTKSFLFYYRAGGRLRCSTLGRYGKLTLDEARRIARIQGGKVAEGADPAAEKIALRKAENFAAAARRFLDGYGEQHLKPSTLTAYRSIVGRLLVPYFGTMKLDDIDTGAVHRWHEAMRRTPRQANQALAILSKILNEAVLWKARKAGLGNPCKYVRRYPETVRDRALDPQEIVTVFAAMETMKTEWHAAEAGLPTGRAKAHPGSLDCIKLMLLTGTRRGEIVNLRWEEVDLESDPPVLRLKNAKEKKVGDERRKVVALSRSAVALIRSQPDALRLSQYVFPGTVKGKPWSGLKRIWDRVLVEAKVEPARLHDLRHSFGTMAGALGLSGPEIQAALNHAHPATTSRYVNLKDKQKAKVAEAIDGVLEQAMLEAIQ